MGDDGSFTMLNLNSHTAALFSVLYQYSNAAGEMCMANLELTPTD